MKATVMRMVIISAVRSIGSSVRTRALRAALASRDRCARWRSMAAFAVSHAAMATRMVKPIEANEPTSRLPSEPWPNHEKASRPQTSSSSSRLAPPMKKEKTPLRTGR